MNISEIKNLSDSDILTELNGLRVKLRDLYFKLSTNDLKNYTLIKGTKIKIAKILTIINQRKKDVKNVKK
jgi:ribosomal protein L29